MIHHDCYRHQNYLYCQLVHSFVYDEHGENILIAKDVLKFTCLEQQLAWPSIIRGPRKSPRRQTAWRLRGERCWQLPQPCANNEEHHGSVGCRPFGCKLVLILTSSGARARHYPQFQNRRAVDDAPASRRNPRAAVPPSDRGPRTTGTGNAWHQFPRDIDVDHHVASSNFDSTARRGARRR